MGDWTNCKAVDATKWALSLFAKRFKILCRKLKVQDGWAGCVDKLVLNKDNRLRIVCHVKSAELMNIIGL